MLYLRLEILRLKLEILGLTFRILRVKQGNFLFPSRDVAFRIFVFKSRDFTFFISKFLLINAKFKSFNTTFCGQKHEISRRKKMILCDINAQL